MHWTEIVTIALLTGYAAFMLAYLVRRRKKGESLEELNCPFASSDAKRLVKEFRKAKRREEKKRARAKRKRVL
ncbi:MAG: hypothetical protein LKK13_04760 [Bacilli bacterium]|jgi:xanthine dehydrogenase iron-sulfur cluster and FAD-binding subunit A|nr:hypothetical protein [Bacilli bacterium]